MLRRWKTGATTTLTSVLFCGSTLACSHVQNDSSTSKDSESFRYDFVAAVVDEEVVDDPRSPGKKMIAALRFRVIRSSGTEPVVGSIVAMGYQYTGAVSSTCNRVTRDLTLRDWSAETRVRIQTNDLYSAESISTVDQRQEPAI
jgi:hypothetical protein